MFLTDLPCRLFSHALSTGITRHQIRSRCLLIETEFFSGNSQTLGSTWPDVHAALKGCHPCDFHAISLAGAWKPIYATQKITPISPVNNT